MKTVLFLAVVFLVVYFAMPEGCRSRAASVSQAVAAEVTKEAEPAMNRALSRQREIFGRIIRGFEEESQGLGTVLEEGKESLLNFRSAIREARDQDAEFDRVYATWEDVAAKTQAVREQFGRLVDGAAHFYAAAEEQAGTISDEALREESLRYIETSRDSYLERLEATRNAIRQVDTMKVAVDDTMKALEIRFAVDVVDQRIAAMFEQIDRMVDDVLRALRELEIESQQVLGTVSMR